jgi:hypothetical protein
VAGTVPQLAAGRPLLPRAALASSSAGFKKFIEASGQETGAWRGAIGEQPRQPDEDDQKPDKR